MDERSKASRRQFLHKLGLGAVGLVAFNGLFARQFARATTPVELPKMVYDPRRQMMVDPETQEPVYSRPRMLAADDKNDKREKKPKPLPTVTAGCPDCPKCDDNCG
jgi:hypothetical protein